MHCMWELEKRIWTENIQYFQTFTLFALGLYIIHVASLKILILSKWRFQKRINLDHFVGSFRTYTLITESFVFIFDV